MRTGREPVDEEGGKRFWAERMMRYYDELKTLPAWQRMRFVKEVASRTGWAQNTIQRQLAGLLFIEAQGKDPRELRDGVSLMSIEAVAKIMRQDPEKGRALLEDVMERRLTTRQVADIYKRNYREEKPVAGGYKRGSTALASLYADIGNDVSVDQPVISEMPSSETAMPGEPVAFRMAEHGGERPTEIVAPMSLVAKRLVKSLRDRMSGRIDVEFAPEVLAPNSMSGRIRPLLYLKDENGARASVFVHDGAVHRREAAFAFALGRAMLSGDNVFAYVAEPGPGLVAELQDLVAQNEAALDVRRERIVVHSSVGAFEEKLDNIQLLQGLFAEKAA